jgi:UDP-N-acetylglucosamine transferase subunit ALG13
VVCHAGDGSILAAVRAGHVPVVLPRLARYGEAVDDHQLELAAHLSLARHVIAVADPADLRRPWPAPRRAPRPATTHAVGCRRRSGVRCRARSGGRTSDQARRRWPGRRREPA